MQSQDEKLEKFLQAINEYSRKQRAAILMELEAQNRIELQRAEEETLSDAYRLIQLQTADVRESVLQELSRFEQYSRRELLEKRGELEQSVMTKASHALAGFTKTAGYDNYLTAVAAAAAKAFSGAEGETVFCLRPEDMGKTEVIKAAFGMPCAFEEDGDITLGGVTVENRALGLFMDATLESRLELQHQWFIENSGMTVC